MAGRGRARPPRRGFDVPAAWVDRESDSFVWVIAHAAPDGWDAAERGYYDSPGRAALPVDPRSFLEDVETRLLEPVDVPAG